MAFDLFPALDVKDGRLASLVRGDPGTLETFEGDPFEAARRLVAAGAAWLHLVDLNAALEGRPANLDLLERVSGLPVRVQAGGGLSVEGARAALDRGAARAVVSAAAADREEAAALIRSHPERVAVGVDVRGDRLAPRGGRSVEAPLGPVLDWLASLSPPPAAVVWTDVARDGAMAGPDLQGLRRAAALTGLPVVASGGVRSLEDLRALAAAGADVAGAVVGRALREGAFTLEEALGAVS